MYYFKIATTIGTFFVATAEPIRNRRQALTILLNRFDIPPIKEEEITEIEISNFFTVFVDNLFRKV